MNLFDGNTINIVGSALFYTLPVSVNLNTQTVNLQNNPNCYTQPVNYPQYKDRLNQIFFLKDNWDGYGACAPSLEVYNNVIHFLNSLSGDIKRYLPADNIEPTPYGTITIDFENKDKLVSVEIGKTKIGFFSELPIKPTLRLIEENFSAKKLPEKLIQAFGLLMQ